MKEIKFRIWNGKNNFCTKSYVETNLFNILKSNPEFIQQFTEVHDTNGKEIYDGDIVEVGNEFEKTRHEIKWFGDEDYPAFDLEPNLSDDANGLSAVMQGNEYGEIEVIGNIYENPELLK